MSTERMGDTLKLRTVRVYWKDFTDAGSLQNRSYHSSIPVAVFPFSISTGLFRLLLSPFHV